MQAVSNDTFGPLIAYLVPGVTALWGVSLFNPTIQSWLAVTSASAPSVGGFLYLTIAALTMGMTVTAIRWAVIDTSHAITGLPPPKLDFAQLPGRVDSLTLLIEIHYRHYQFHALCGVLHNAYYADLRIMRR